MVHPQDSTPVRLSHGRCWRYPPLDQSILQGLHCSTRFNLGIQDTNRLVQNRFSLATDVATYVRNCNEWATSKYSRQLPSKLLHPLPFLLFLVSYCSGFHHRPCSQGFQTFWQLSTDSQRPVDLFPFPKYTLRVGLSTRVLHLQLPCNKVPGMLILYKIIRQIDPVSFKLQRPISPTFHVSLLKPMREEGSQDT